MKRERAEERAFKLLVLEEAGEFLLKVPKPAYNKIIYNVDRIASGEKNAELFSKLGDSNIWEFRTLYSGIAYRLFAFWDKEGETLVVATHGIVKKSQKTPHKEIAKAETIRKIYFEDKQMHK